MGHEMVNIGSAPETRREISMIGEIIRSEAGELNNKVLKLSGFMLTDGFQDMEPTDQGLLMVQLEAMRLHLRTLGKRIARL